MKRISCVTLLICLTYLSFSQTIKDDSRKEYPIKFSASPDTIKINQNLPDGINEINKTRSGYTLSVKVKDHKITDMNWVDPLGKKLTNYVQATPDAKLMQNEFGFAYIAVYVV